MTTATRTADRPATRSAPHPAARPAARRFGLAAILARLVDADARYRQAGQMARLTADQRRDMGLPAADGARPVLDRRFLTGQW